MRRIAGLLVAPTSAVADPVPAKPDEDGLGQHFEWSMSTGRGRLGVMVLGLTPELREHFRAPSDRGVMIARVEPKSVAETAGLAVGDVLT